MRHSTQNAGDHTQLTSVRRLFTGLNTLKDMSVHHNSQLTAHTRQQRTPQLTPVRRLFTGKNTLKDMSVHHNSQLTAHTRQQRTPQLKPVRCSQE